MGDLELALPSSVTIILALLFSLTCLTLVRMVAGYLNRVWRISDSSDRNAKGSQSGVDVTQQSRDLKKLSFDWRWSLKWESLPLSLPVSLTISETEMVGVSVGNGAGVGLGAGAVVNGPPSGKQIKWNLQARGSGPAFDHPREY